MIWLLVFYSIGFPFIWFELKKARNFGIIVKLLGLYILSPVVLSGFLLMVLGVLLVSPLFVVNFDNDVKDTPKNTYGNSPSQFGSVDPNSPFFTIHINN